jgi:integrase
MNREVIAANPWKKLRRLKAPGQDWHWCADEEVRRLLNVTPDLYWQARILLAYTAGLRKGELLNFTWADVEFATQAIQVAPKEQAEECWPWMHKDSDRRKSPLTDESADLLVELHGAQPAGHPYVLVPLDPYWFLIQEMRVRPICGNWKRSWRDVVNNFTQRFQLIVRKAGIRDHATFHDIRKTCTTNWFRHGLAIHEVKDLVGHSSIVTTERYFLRVDETALTLARKASSALSLRPAQTHFRRTAPFSDGSRSRP